MSALLEVKFNLIIDEYRCTWQFDYMDTVLKMRKESCFTCRNLTNTFSTNSLG